MAYWQDVYILAVLCEGFTPENQFKLAARQVGEGKIRILRCNGYNKPIQLLTNSRAGYLKFG